MSVTAVPLRPISRRALMILWIGIAFAMIGGVALAWNKPSDANSDFLAANASAPGVVTTASGLQYQVIAPGAGAKPTDADVALVGYRGTLTDGTQFDANEQAPMPVAGVVPGFSEGLKLMSKGARYKFWIPPALGYGDQDMGNGAIPANSVLIFEVELLDFLPEQIIRQMQMQQQMGMPPGGPSGPPPGAAPPAP